MELSCGDRTMTASRPERSVVEPARARASISVIEPVN
jgi:hypothetical protein